MADDLTSWDWEMLRREGAALDAIDEDVDAELDTLPEYESYDADLIRDLGLDANRVGWMLDNIAAIGLLVAESRDDVQAELFVQYAIYGVSAELIGSDPDMPVSTPEAIIAVVEDVTRAAATSLRRQASKSSQSETRLTPLPDGADRSILESWLAESIEQVRSYRKHQSDTYLRSLIEEARLAGFKVGPRSEGRRYPDGVLDLLIARIESESSRTERSSASSSETSPDPIGRVQDGQPPRVAGVEIVDLGDGNEVHVDVADLGVVDASGAVGTTAADRADVIGRLQILAAVQAAGRLGDLSSMGQFMLALQAADAINDRALEGFAADEVRATAEAAVGAAATRLRHDERLTLLGVCLIDGDREVVTAVEDAGNRLGLTDLFDDARCAASVTDEELDELSERQLLTADGMAAEAVLCGLEAAVDHRRGHPAARAWRRAAREWERTGNAASAERCRSLAEESDLPVVITWDSLETTTIEAR